MSCEVFPECPEAARVGAIEAEDGLVVVAHNGDPLVPGNETQEQVLLRARVLELVHQHVGPRGLALLQHCMRETRAANELLQQPSPKLQTFEFLISGNIPGHSIRTFEPRNM